MSVSGPQNGFPHYEGSAASIMWLLRNSPYQQGVGTPWYPPVYATTRRAARKSSALLRGGGGTGSSDGGGDGSAVSGADDIGRVYHAGRGGFNSFFRNVARAVKPVLYRGAQALAEEGVKIGTDVLEDWKQNKSGNDGVPFNLKDSARKSFESSRKRLKRSLPQILLGRGMSKKKRTTGKQKKKQAKVGGGVKKNQRISALRLIPVCANKKKTKQSGGGRKKKRATKAKALAAWASPSTFRAGEKNKGRLKKAEIKRPGPDDIYTIP